MITPFTRFLDWLFGPREWCVVRLLGGTFAIPKSEIIAGDRIVRSGLRFGAAQRLARRLRQKAEDTPEAVI